MNLEHRIQETEISRSGDPVTRWWGSGTQVIRKMVRSIVSYILSIPLSRLKFECFDQFVQLLLVGRAFVQGGLVFFIGSDVFFEGGLGGACVENAEG